MDVDSDLPRVMGDWDQIPAGAFDQSRRQCLKFTPSGWPIVLNRLPPGRHLSVRSRPAPLEHHPSCELSSPLPAAEA